jgi:hypothetical protein
MKQSVRTTLAVIVMLAAVARGADAQTTGAELRSDIQRLMELTGSAAMAAQMSSLVSSQLLDGLKRSQPAIPDRAITVLKEVLDSEFSKMFSGPDGIQPRLVDLYAKAFTREDIAALIEFYNSTVGRKAIAAMPGLSQEGAALGKAWAEANMPRIMGVAQDRLRAEGLLK